MPRKLRNWVDGFYRYTEGKGSPPLYRKWAAIYTVAAALERKVWVRTAKGVLYPNMYVVLVGNAGVGKSLGVGLTYDLLEGLPNLKLAPTSVTKASLIDRLMEAERTVIRPMDNPSIITFNSLQVIVNELGVFLPEYNSEFMSALTDLWDCKNYHETRRTHKIDIKIPATQLNIFSATTPSYLNNFLPEGAWEQGFMSRVLLVYSGNGEYTDMFQENTYDEGLWKELKHDLNQIHSLYGQFQVTEEVKVALNEWGRSGGQPAPTHPKLSHYLSRRAAHLLKLMQVSAAASDDDRIISLDHFAEALDWLIELEASIPDIFKAMKVGGDGRTIEECWHFVYERFIREKEPVLEHRIFHFLQERTPAHNVQRLIDVMEKARLIEKKLTAGGIGYEPKGKRAA